MERIKCPSLLDKVMSAEEAAMFVQDGMTVGASGFTVVNYPKAVPMALANRVKNGDKLKITLINGGSVGDELDGELARAGAISRRYGFQNNRDMRAAINRGEVLFADTHVSRLPYQLRTGYYGKIDLAIIEVAAVEEDGALIPGLAIGISETLAEVAEKVILEVNETIPMVIDGFHDVYVSKLPPHTEPIPITGITQRVGSTRIHCDPSKVVAVVRTSGYDGNKNLPAPDENMKAIAGHIVKFLKSEVAAGRLSDPLPPLQSGVGGVANAVLTSLVNSDFKHMTVFTEVMQDAVLELMDAGKVDFATGTALTISPSNIQSVYSRLHEYKDRIVIRPQEISNSPELIHRFGVIAMNTAIEFDIEGQVNSTHVGGTSVMNGVGGSGDFARNAGVCIFTTASTAKNGTVSCVVPHVSHVDHTEHDTQIFVTEQGLADLRGLTPYERANAIIDNCAHPDYREYLHSYVERSRECSKAKHELMRLDNF